MSLTHKNQQQQQQLLSPSRTGAKPPPLDPSPHPANPPEPSPHTSQPRSSAQLKRSTKKSKRTTKNKLQLELEAEAEGRAGTEVRWVAHRKLSTGSKLGLYDPAPPGALSSTRQMEASLLAVAAPPTNHKGLIFGLDTSTGWIITHDPFFAYGHTVQNPNVCYIGDVGSGKSSAMKTWGLLRPLILGRDIVVLDKKRQKNTGEGEYAPLCRHLGREPITFKIGGGGSCINILDPRIGAGETNSADTGPRQDSPCCYGQSPKKPSVAR